MIFSKNNTKISKTHGGNQTKKDCCQTEENKIKATTAATTIMIMNLCNEYCSLIHTKEN